MHVLNPSTLLEEPYERVGYLPDLFLLLRQRKFRFNIQDHNGRTILLMLLQERVFHRYPALFEAYTTYLLDEEDLWRTSYLGDSFGLSAAMYLSELIQRATGVRGLERTCGCYRKLYGKCQISAPTLGTMDIGFLSCEIPAARWKHKKFVSVIGEYGIRCDGSPNTLHQLAKDSWKSNQLPARKERLQQLLDTGSDINAYDADGLTPLMLVAMGARGEETDIETGDMVKEFISKGANIQQRDRQDRTALHVAAGSGKITATRALIRKGAMLNARTKKGQSVLGFANKALRRAKKKGELYTRIMACVTILIDHGAVVDPSPGQEWAMGVRNWKLYRSHS